jgi:hypothetical protein
MKKNSGVKNKTQQDKTRHEQLDEMKQKEKNTQDERK